MPYDSSLHYHTRRKQLQCSFLCYADCALHISEGIRIVLISGSVFLLVDHHLSKWKISNGCDLDVRYFVNRFLHKNHKGNKRYLSKCIEAPISCSSITRNDSFLPSNEQQNSAKLIYSVAPAMGHNQVQVAHSFITLPFFLEAWHGNSRIFSKFCRSARSVRADCNYFKFHNTKLVSWVLLDWIVWVSKSNIYSCIFK